MSRATSSAKNFHLPLPEAVHRELRDVATRSGRPATVLVREAVEEWLRAQRRARIDEEVRLYAEKWGGTEMDLDPVLERAAAEELFRKPRRKARAR